MDEDNKKFPMQKLADNIEDAIAKTAKGMGLDEQDIEVILPPCVQSGGAFDLKYSATTDDKASLHLPAPSVPAVHITSISLRHKFCTCSIARTLVFNGKKEQKENYTVLLDTFEAVLAKVKSGVRIRELWETATSKIKESRPDLLKNLTKELGWGMGYEIRERRFSIDEKNKQPLQEGMVLCVRLGFEGLELAASTKDERSKKYALLIADSLIVTDSGYELVTGVNKAYKKISWNVQDEEEEKSKKEGPSKKDIEDAVKKLDNSKKEKEKTAQEREEEQHQFEAKNALLAQRRLDEQKARRNGTAVNEDDTAASQVTPPPPPPPPLVLSGHEASLTPY